MNSWNVFEIATEGGARTAHTPRPVKIFGVIPSREAELPWAQDTADSLRAAGAQDVAISTIRGLSNAKNEGFRSLPPGDPEDVILFVDNDTLIEGDLRWFLDRPFSESFWVPRYVCHTDDFYSALGVVFINGINHLHLWPASIGPCIVVRRKVAQAHTFNPRALLEDLWFGATMRKAGINCRVAPIRAHVHRPFSTPKHWARTNREVYAALQNPV